MRQPLFCQGVFPGTKVDVEFSFKEKAVFFNILSDSGFSTKKGLSRMR